jgi:hypothetical protein
MDQRERAQAFVERGWRVFPVEYRDKRPIKTGGVKPDGTPKRMKWGTATASVPTPQMLDIWFSGDEPVNIGIAAKNSHLVMLDEDRLGGLVALCEAYGQPVPITYRVRTKDGWHYYFDAPQHIEIGNSTHLKEEYGIDVRGGRGDGGYVVAAGSVHESGWVYEAEDEAADTIELPWWLVELLLPDPEPASVTVLNAEPRTDRRYTPEEADRWIERYGLHPLRSSTEGGRNNTLNTAAMVLGHFVPHHISEHEARAGLTNIAREIGLRVDEIGPTISSGLAAGMKDPYTVSVPDAAPDQPGTVEDGGEDGDLIGSWRPKDLTAAITGTKERAEPTIGIERSDGVRMLYPGKEHSCFGETEAGKSWFALACAAAELEAGNLVLYVHFEEDDESDTVDRMLRMGVRPDVLLQQFLFVGPIGRITQAAIDQFREEPPSLVVLDGKNEGMSLHGLAIREEDGAAEYRRRLVKPFTAMGAAVLDLDHVVKDRDSKSEGYALGSIHKINGLSGAAILMENREPFGDGRTGFSTIYVTKDRPGQVRKHGVPHERITRKFYLGDLRVDSTEPKHSAVTFWAPSPEMVKDAEDSAADRIEREVLEAIGAIIASKNEANVRAIQAAVPRAKAATADAIERLKLHGQILERKGAARGARVFTVIPGATVPGDSDE